LESKLAETSEHSKWHLEDFFNSKAKEAITLLQVLHQ
jgi:hypothetical protein